jgi:transposase
VFVAVIMNDTCTQALSVSDEEWHLIAPYLALVRENAGQRQHPSRELFNGLRYVIRYGIA